MKKIKAIYLPDLAFDSKVSFVFEYNNSTNKFHLATDNEFVYDIISLIEDEEWYVFETELKGISETYYGSVKRIPNEILEDYIKKYNEK